MGSKMGAADPNYPKIQGLSRLSRLSYGIAAPRAAIPTLGSGEFPVAVYDDGSGPALYVGGLFDVIDGVEAKGIARYDGKSFAPVGEGFQHGETQGPFVSAMAIYEGELHVGGNFTKAGDREASDFARWDGSSWAPFGLFEDSDVFQPRGHAPNNRPDRLLVLPKPDGSSLLAVGGQVWMNSMNLVQGLVFWDGLQGRWLGGRHAGRLAGRS